MKLKISIIYYIPPVQNGKPSSICGFEAHEVGCQMSRV